MNEDISTPMTPLDSMLSLDSIQIMKAAVPYLPGRSQQILSIFAKALELSHTISFFHRPQPELQIMSAAQTEEVPPAQMLNEIRKYAAGPARNQIDQLIFTLNTIQLIQMYQENPESQEVKP